jgi:hypothetical protein
MPSSRRFSSGVLVVVACGVAGACMVETPVVDGGDGGDDDGGGEAIENLPTWCNAICNGLRDCGPVPPPDSCVQECITQFEAFENKSETCTQAGRRAMRCLEIMRCTGLDGAEGSDADGIEDCLVSDEQTRCRESLGLTSCTSLYLDDDHAGTCEIHTYGCANDLDYRLECESEGEFARCTCLTGDVVNGAFAPLGCPSQKDAIRSCGWPVVPPGGPDLVPPVRCELGGSSVPGDDGTGCSINFLDCSDGHSYGVNCNGAERSFRCECTIDGQKAVDNTSFYDRVCPFALDDDEGRTAMNDACGFSIAPFR